MPEITPSFVNARKLIQIAAAELGCPVSVRRAKSLAHQMLTQADEWTRRTWADPTGETAVKNVQAWLLEYA